LVVDLVTGPFRPGFSNNAYVTLRNIGTTAESGSLDVTLANADVSILSVTPQAGIISNNTVTIPYALNPGEEVMYILHHSTSLTAIITTPIQSTASALNALDLTPGNNTITIDGFITGSYDPNDKSVFPAGAILPSFISNGEKLDYTINFQNTGNDTAFTVLLIDTLSNNLDLSTFQILSNSHPMVVNFYDNVVWFRFNNILLPDSNTNENMSHGFVKYRIQPKSSLILGDEINNTAYIYFDFNAPIITNTTNTIIALPTAILDKDGQIDLNLSPNPVHSNGVKIKSGSPIILLEVSDVTGKIIVNSVINHLMEFNLNTNEFSSGVYHVKVITESGTSVERLLKQ